MSQHLPGSTTHRTWVSLYPFVRRLTTRVKALAPHRDLVFEVEGAPRARVFTDQVMLGEVLLGLIRNAFENTPDKGSVTIRLEEQDGKSYIQVADCGIGIVDEDKVSLFDGLSPARDIEYYTSKRPYDFGAGGKGLDLLRMRLYAERFGFEFSMKSKRCAFLPTDRDLCPGDVSLCSHCRVVDDCLASGGSTFTVAFALTPGPGRRSGRRASEVKH
jgi:signal transduction histidine kinase